MRLPPGSSEETENFIMCSWGHSPLGNKCQLAFCFSVPRYRGALWNLDECFKYILADLPRDIKVIVADLFFMVLRKLLPYYFPHPHENVPGPQMQYSHMNDATAEGTKVSGVVQGMERK